MIAASFRREARFAWRAMVEAATDAERPALVEIADLLFEYVDRVSRIYSEVYGSAEKRRGPSAEEEAARELLRRIAAEDETLTEDQQLAERIGFRLERAATPFVIAIPDGSAQRHAELRGAVALAAGQGDSSRRGDRAASAPSARARGARGVALAARAGLGEIEVGDYLPALMLGLPPHRGSDTRSRLQPARWRSPRACPHPGRLNQKQLREGPRRRCAARPPQHIARPDRSNLRAHRPRSRGSRRQGPRVAGMARAGGVGRLGDQ